MGTVIPAASMSSRRTLASAALAASLLAADLVLIALILNPGISLQAEALPILASLFLPYLLAVTPVYVAVATLLGIYQWWPRSLKRPIAALPWFTTLTLLSMLAASALFWFNLLSYRDSIPLEAVTALRGSAICVSGAALALVAVSVNLLVFPYRRRGGSAALVVLASAAAVVVPLALRPEPAPARAPVPLETEPTRPVRSVTLIGVDGIGAAQLRRALDAGRLPHFARLVNRGAFAPLATLQPTEGPPVWTSIFTGRSPRAHGVKSFLTYRLLGSSAVWELLPKGALVRLLEAAGLVSTAPVTAASRRSPALWTALNAFGIQTGVVRFWGTHPPEPVQGFMLSNYFHVLKDDPARLREALHPPDLAAEVASRAVAPEDVERTLVSALIDTSVEAPAGSEPLHHELFERALAPDLSYRRAAELLQAAYAPQFLAVYYYGADVAGHAFTRHAHPERFGNVSPEEVRRYGGVVDGYAELLGSWIGERAEALGAGEILIVVSGYGMEEMPLWRRVVSILTGSPAASGTHSGAPPGFLIALGDAVKPGATARSASVLDIAPTILYLMGLPVARDMEGRVLTEILDDAFARSHPMTFIPSYASLAVTPAVDPLDPQLPPPQDDQP